MHMQKFGRSSYKRELALGGSKRDFYLEALFPGIRTILPILRDESGCCHYLIFAFEFSHVPIYREALVRARLAFA
jgi:hypothetical protein